MASSVARSHRRRRGCENVRQRSLDSDWPSGRACTFPFVSADISRSRPREATLVASLVLVVGTIGFGLSDFSNLLSWFALVLAVCATAAEFISARYAGVLRVSGVFMCGNLAVGFLGPAAAFAIPAAAHLV